MGRQSYFVSGPLTIYRWLSKRDYKSILACRMHRFELDRHYDEIEWNNIDSVLFISDAMERKFHEELRKI